MKYEVSYWGRQESKWITQQNQLTDVVVWSGKYLFVALWKMYMLKRKGYQRVRLTMP